MHVNQAGGDHLPPDVDDTAGLLDRNAGGYSGDPAVFNRNVVDGVKALGWVDYCPAPD
jgi:hypothetical protein